MIEYKIGDTVAVATGGEVRLVKVEARESDIKNGRGGFDGELVGHLGAPVFGNTVGEHVWGYDEQILHVAERAA